jgi:hypothetical protein
LSVVACRWIASTASGDGGAVVVHISLGDSVALQKLPAVQSLPTVQVQASVFSETPSLCVQSVGAGVVQRVAAVKFRLQ